MSRAHLSRNMTLGTSHTRRVTWPSPDPQSRRVLFHTASRSVGPDTSRLQLPYPCPRPVQSALTPARPLTEVGPPIPSAISPLRSVHADSPHQSAGLPQPVPPSRSALSLFSC